MILKNIFYLEGNPTYKLFNRLDFDSVVATKIIMNPTTKEMVDGVIFKKNQVTICHLTLSNLLYVYLIDEGNVQLKSKNPARFVHDIKTHSGFIESRQRRHDNPNQDMFDVYLQGTKFDHFILK